MKKRYLLAFVSAISVLALLFVCVFSASEEERVEKYLKKSHEHLQVVADYLLNSQQDYVYFLDGSGYVYEGYKKTVDNDAVLDSVQYLFNRYGYKKVIKTGNTVRFVKWTRLNDYEAGICYSSDDMPKIEFLTDTFSLSAEGWYYYEADYNEWRLNY